MYHLGKNCLVEVCFCLLCLSFLGRVTLYPYNLAVLEKMLSGPRRRAEAQHPNEVIQILAQEHAHIYEHGVSVVEVFLVDEVFDSQGVYSPGNDQDN